MRTPLVTVLAMSFLVAVLPAQGVSAQEAGASSLPQGVLFDDFVYATAAFDRARPDTLQGSVFGPARWRVADSVEVERRAWYRWLWSEHLAHYGAVWDGRDHPHPGVSLRPAADAPEGVLVFRTEADAEVGPRGACVPSEPLGCDADAAHKAQQIASGFAFRRGVWAARLAFDTLPKRRPGGRDEDPVLRVIQAFWTVSPHSVRVGDERVWAEMDHEYNNWFHWASADRQGRSRVFNATGFYEQSSQGNSRRWPLRGLGRGAPFTCAYAQGGNLQVLDVTACADSLGQMGATRYTVAVIRHQGHRLRFEVHQPRADGFLTATSPWFVEDEASRQHEVLPSQPMVALFDQGLDVPAGSPPARLGQSLELRLDWFYYAEDAQRKLSEILRDVEGLRAQAVPRLNTVSCADPVVRCETIEYGLTGEHGVSAGVARAMLSAPVEACGEAPLPACPADDPQWVGRRYRDADTTLTLRLDGPRQVARSRLGTTDWIALPTQRPVWYGLTWRYAYLAGRDTVSVTSDVEGYRLRPAPPRCARRCTPDRLVITALLTDPAGHGIDEGLQQTRARLVVRIRDE